MASTEGLRSVLKKYRDQGRISSKLYSDFYGRAKGGMFKSEKAMLEHLHKAMAEAGKTASAEAAAEAKKTRARARASGRTQNHTGDTSADHQEREFSVGQAVSVDYNGETYAAVIAHYNLVEGTYRVTYAADNTYEDVESSRISTTESEVQAVGTAPLEPMRASGGSAEEHNIDGGYPPETEVVDDEDVAENGAAGDHGDSVVELDDQMQLLLQRLEPVRIEDRRDQVLDLLVSYIEAVGEPVNVDRLNILVGALRAKFNYGIALRKKKGQQNKGKLEDDDRMIISAALLQHRPRLVFTPPRTVSLSAESD